MQSPGFTPHLVGGVPFTPTPRASAHTLTYTSMLSALPSKEHFIKTGRDDWTLEGNIMVSQEC